MRRVVQRIAPLLVTILVGGAATGCVSGEPQINFGISEPAVTAAECRGVNALEHSREACDAALVGQPLDPLLNERAADIGDSFECFTYADEVSLKSCAPLSPGEPEVRVAIVGDSHAAMLAPSLTTSANERGWEMQAMVSNGCVWTNSPSSERCDQRLAEQKNILLGGDHFDIVIVSSVATSTVTSETQEIINKRFDQLVEAGSAIVVVQDNPRLAAETESCIDAADSDQVIAGRCDFDQADAYPMTDQYWLVAQQRDDIASVMTSDLFCDDGVCPVEIGGLIVYRDIHHLTATYAASIADELLRRIDAAAGSI